MRAARGEIMEASGESQKALYQDRQLPSSRHLNLPPLTNGQMIDGGLPLTPGDHWRNLRPLVTGGATVGPGQVARTCVLVLILIMMTHMY